MRLTKVADVRLALRQLLIDKQYVVGRNGATVEILGATFLADEEAILGTINKDYVQRELAWYMSQSLNIHDFPAPIPKVWRDCAGKDGSVNSNYGWCLFSGTNGYQYDKVKLELQQNPETRRAVAIYTRPSIHDEATKNGRQDFICTNAVEYFLRNGILHCVVQMRSSDAVFGYRNDRAWHVFVLATLAKELNVEVGKIHWQAGSLHVYERHFKLLEAL